MNDLISDYLTADPEMVQMMNALQINAPYAWGTDKATRHNYTAVFAQLLAPYRNKDCRLLEIGTLGGGSAVLWRNYLPNAWLDLVDRKQRLVPKNLERLERFAFHELDAYCSETVRKFKAEDQYDIIIDDGSHRLVDLVYVAKHYYPLLAPGGVLILEDIPDERLLPDLADLFTPEQQKGIRVFDMRESGRFDDLIWSIQRH